MDRRKLLVIVGLLAAVIALGAAIYFLFFRRPPVPEAPPEVPPELVPITAPPVTGRPTLPAPPGGIIPTAPTPPVAPPSGAPPTAVASGGRTAVAALTDTPASFVHLAADGRPVYYDPTRAQFFRIGADGKSNAIADREFPNVQSVAWAPDATRAILEFPDGANVAYDFRTKRQVTLPAHWETFSFSPDGNRIAGKSMALDRENRYLFEADPDGNDVRPIEPLGANASRVDVTWAPHSGVVALSRTGLDIGDGRQQVLAIGRFGENFPAITVEGRGFEPQWSPTGTRLLYSAVSGRSDYLPNLWLVDGAGDAIGGNRQRLGVATWAHKCAFADDRTLYCAVPERLERGYGLQPELADGVPDTIERIDLTTGIRTTVGQPANDASVSRLSVAPDGRTLYFTDQRDGRLYEMRLR